MPCVWCISIGYDILITCHENQARNVTIYRFIGNQ